MNLPKAFARAQTVDGEQSIIELKPARVLFETQYVLYGFKPVEIAADCTVDLIMVDDSLAECNYDLKKGDIFTAGAKFFPSTLMAQCGKRTSVAPGEDLVKRVGAKLGLPQDEIQQVIDDGIEQQVEEAIQEAKEENENYETP